MLEQQIKEFKKERKTVREPNANMIYQNMQKKKAQPWRMHLSD